MFLAGPTFFILVTPGLGDPAPSREDVHLDDGYKDAVLSHLM